MAPHSALKLPDTGSPRRYWPRVPARSRLAVPECISRDGDDVGPGSAHAMRRPTIKRGDRPDCLDRPTETSGDLTSHPTLRPNAVPDVPTDRGSRCTTRLTRRYTAPRARLTPRGADSEPQQAKTVAGRACRLASGSSEAGPNCSERFAVSVPRADAGKPLHPNATRPSPLNLGRIGIAGAGNVGSALALCIAQMGAIGRVELCARHRSRAIAARSDALSAYPEAWNTLVDVDVLSGPYDIVIVTAGQQPSRGSSRVLLYEINLAIAKWFLRDVELSTGFFVVVGTPVDELTTAVTRLLGGDHHRAIGFGGELDRSRLKSLLLERGEHESVSNAAFVVGEHGERTIPVFAGTQSYDAIRDAVRTTLSEIMEATGSARNLASGAHLSQLIRALRTEKSAHCVTTLVDQYGMHLTWPCALSPKGVEPLTSVEIQASAEPDFLELLRVKRLESPIFSGLQAVAKWR